MRNRYFGGASACALAAVGLAVAFAAEPAAAPAAGQEEGTTEIRPFEISVPDAVLADLRVRLAATRFPDQVGDPWVYGTDIAYLRQLVDYWRDDYDWRAQERRLNALDHYKTRIDGLDIHFIHQRSPEPDALPIVITHGWPGSVVEFLEVIGPLTDPVAHGGDAADAFHVVAPSMPGYGFSDKPRVPGTGPEQIADINAQLMARLGYERYGAQGGDWGAAVSTWLAAKYSEQVAGLHLNMAFAGPPADSDDPTGGATPEELARMQARQAELADGFAYTAIQGTKPQTLGYGLNDSPAGLAGWIVEKFQSWCDCSGNPETIFTKDQLLTNIMLYWVTGTATSAARLYYESSRQAAAGLIFMPEGRIEVPTGVALFPEELILPPRAWVERQFNLTHWTEMPRGGHFAAFEQPELFVEDLRTFYRDLR
ncbi:MAG: epoxide hydrolase [Acidobacteria bacterium]|nr:epoxide hydrolase [Acidobacteriota bacterium]